jgi:hypothetical protein
MSGEHLPINLPKGSLDDVVSAWNEKYLLYQQKVASHEKIHQSWLLEDPESRGSAPKKPKEEPSPWARLSTASENALQVVDGLLAYSALPHHLDSPSHIQMITHGKLNYVKLSDTTHRSRLQAMRIECVMGRLVPCVRSCALLESLFSLYTMLFAMYIVGKAESFLKLKLAYLEAHSKNQTEFPPIPAPFRPQSLASKNMFGGKIGLNYGNWLCSDRFRCQEFVFNMKRLSPKASDEMLAAEAQKSFDILTTPQADKSFRIPSGLHRGERYDLDRASEAVRRTVREYFIGKKFCLDRAYRLASTHAHFDGGPFGSRTRSAGGARGHLTKGQASEQDVLYTVHESVPCPNGDWTRNWIIQEVSRPTYPTDSYGWDGCVGVQLLKIFSPPEESIRTTHSNGHWYIQTLQKIITRNSLIVCSLSDEPLPAKIVTLAEPLKIRSITCGPTSDYWWASYLQEWLHDTLRHTKAFTLIGGTEEGVPIHLNNVQTRFSRPLRDGWFYVSGDYQAATNLISGRLSNEVAREISRICELPQHLEELFVKALTGHNITVDGETVGEQKNGQLMGSPVSFPVLCLINAALTRDSQELAGVIPLGTTVEEMEILINGDDVVFPTNSDGYEMWKCVTACGGLNPSIGKNYTSSDFLVMNSTLFETTYVETSGYHTRTVVPEDSDETYMVCEWFTQQRFSTRHWYNMDYLGPGGPAYFRAKPWQSSQQREMRNSHAMQDLQDHLKMLYKKSRHHGTLTCIDDLFQSENYQILPSLQAKWLGDSEGELRHDLNKLFLATWKDVLDLGYRPKFGKSSELKGHVHFVIDWFLPNQLGGYGLEETSGKGVQASSLESRKLARYLMRNPDEILPYLPSLGQQPRFALEVSDRFRRELDVLRPSSLVIRQSDDLPAGYTEESSLVSRITNEVLMEANYNVYGGEGKRGTGGDFTADRDPTVSLAIGLEKVYRSRARFWKNNYKNKWTKLGPVTQKELDQWQPIRRVLALEPAVQLRAFLGHPDDLPRLVVDIQLRSNLFVEGEGGSSDAYLKTGMTFPGRRRYDPEIIKMWRQMDATPVLPFDWPLYEVRTEFEAQLLTNRYWSEKWEQDYQESLVLGPSARSAGRDILGDSEFDALLAQFSVPKMSPKGVLGSVL